MTKFEHRREYDGVGRECPVHEHNAEDQTREKGLDIDGDGGPGRRRHGVKTTSCVHSFPPSFPSSRSTSLDIDHPYWESEFGICFFHLSGLSSLTDDLSRQSSKSVLSLSLSLFLSFCLFFFSLRTSPSSFPLYSLFSAFSSFSKNISTFYPSLRIHAATGLTRALLRALLYNLFSRYACHSMHFLLCLSLPLSAMKKERKKEKYASEAGNTFRRLEKRERQPVVSTGSSSEFESHCAQNAETQTSRLRPSPFSFFFFVEKRPLIVLAGPK